MDERAARLKQGLQEEGHLVDVGAESSREVAEVTLMPYSTECRLLSSEPTRTPCGTTRERSFWEAIIYTLQRLPF